MEQLSGLDTAFVHQDSRRTPMHVTAVLLYDIGKDETGTITGAFLRRLVAKKLRRFPVFYRKLHRVPMDMDAPYWVDVPAPEGAFVINIGDLRLLSRAVAGPNLSCC